MHTIALLHLLAAVEASAHGITLPESVVLAIVTVCVSVGVAYGLLRGKVDAVDDKVGALTERVKVVEASTPTNARLEERLIALGEKVDDGFTGLRRELENSGVYPRNSRDGE